MRRINIFKAAIILIFTIFTFSFVYSEDYAENSDLLLNRKIAEIISSERNPNLDIAFFKDNNLFIKKFSFKNGAVVKTDNVKHFKISMRLFVAISILQLEEKGLVSLEDNISKYFPWFAMKYKNESENIKIRDLLNHTSGISSSTYTKILNDNSSEAFQNSMKNIIGISLNSTPGTYFEEADFNYIILGALIENVSKTCFEKYMEQNIFNLLGLYNTYIIKDGDIRKLTHGYKRGFGVAMEYNTFEYRSFFPINGAVTTAEDLGRLLQILNGVIENPLSQLIIRTQSIKQKISTISTDLPLYSMGWKLFQRNGNQYVLENIGPNFSSYVVFNPATKTGVAVVSDYASPAVKVIGNIIIGEFSEQKKSSDSTYSSNSDIICSILTFILGIFAAIAIIYFIEVIKGILIGKRTVVSTNGKKSLFSMLSVLSLFATICLVYFLPNILGYTFWNIALLWMPLSFPFAVLTGSFLAFILHLTLFLVLVFPEKNQYKNIAPLVVILSIISGIANTLVIYIITSFFFSELSLFYLSSVFLVILVASSITRRIVQVVLIKASNRIVYDLRMKLINKLFVSSLQTFENIDSGKIFATLNNDTEVIGGSANFIITFVISVITLVAGFTYLATISWKTTLTTIVIIIIVSACYYFVGKKVQKYFEQARDTQNIFMELINGLIRGYKELAIHRNKKIEYRDSLKRVAANYCDSRIVSNTKLTDAFIFGDFMTFVVLGFASIILPRLSLGVSFTIMISFTMILLYLLGPINIIVNFIPNLLQIRVSWVRIQQFISEIPESSDATSLLRIENNNKTVTSIEAKAITFEYANGDMNKNFKVGPINLLVEKGEVVFIIGGNGSGKTTLAKLLTGLYSPDSGVIAINGSVVECQELSEYFSVVFSDFYLFDNLYNINLDGKDKIIKAYLKLLDLEGKVDIVDNKFNTVNLSGGQRKRLALLRCYLEDSPIYLFDEIAADQDPEFRKFFYHNLLPKMKEDGKIVIAITHDDYYFDVADRIIKLDMGQMVL